VQDGALWHVGSRVTSELSSVARAAWSRGTVRLCARYQGPPLLAPQLIDQQVSRLSLGVTMGVVEKFIDLN